MGEHDEHEHDRAAILARRRQFIAVALGSLAPSCAPGKPTPAPVTTSDSATATASSSSGSSTGDGDEDSETMDESTTETESSACLKFDLAPEKFDLPPEPGTDTGDESDTGTDTGPRPCLAPPGAIPE